MKTVKAGALQLVTFITVIIALLLAAFILLLHVHKQFRLKTDHTIESIRLSDKGLRQSDSQTYQDTSTVFIDKGSDKQMSSHRHMLKVW